MHAGIEACVDLLPEIHGFESPVAMVTIIPTTLNWGTIVRML